MPIGFLDGDTWEESVIKAKAPVMVQFVSRTCPVCRAMEAVVDRLAAELGDGLPVYRVDVEEEGDLVWAYEVMSTPTFITFCGGDPLDSLHGQVEPAALWRFAEDAASCGP